MKFKLFMIVAMLLAACSGYTAAFGECEFSGIEPAESLGVFEAGEEVSFTIFYQSDQDTSIQYTISDVWNKVKKSGELLLERTADSKTVCLGKFATGWYRVRFYEFDKEKEDYCAFSVSEPMSLRKNVKNRFAIDQAGQYMDWNKEKREAYAKVLSMAGIDTVRERMSDYDDADYDANIEEQTEALFNHGIRVMQMLARNQSIHYGENLFTTYNKAKKNAEYYGERVKIWESVNEADSDESVTPGEAASYYKARAIGIIDSGAETVKTFGGLCNWNTSFSEVFMQNGVMAYADNFNLHSHRYAQSSEYNRFPSDPVLNARELSTVYGGGKPVWVSEAGISCEIDENETITDECMPIQAKYVVTSAVESIARGGTDKHFWFLARHYIENGREFGIFSGNDMPYAAYSAISALTYYLGEGKLLGELKEKPQSCIGYMFSDGENDTAILWNTEDKTDYVQFNTESDVQIINLVGDSSPIRYSEVNKKINIPVTTYPVMIKFQGTTQGNYFTKRFPEYDEINVKELTDAQRVVLKQNWKTKKTENAQYRIERGQNYTIALNVYNFSDTKMTGSITAEVSGNMKNVSKQTVKYSAAAGGKATLVFTVAANEDYSAGGKAYLSFGGVANGEEITPSVSECYVVPDTDNMEKTIFEGCSNENQWRKNSTAEMQKFGQATDAAGMKFIFDFKAEVLDRWAYPRLAVTKGALKDSDGIGFEIEVDSAKYALSDMNMKVFVWTQSGASYLAYAGDCQNGKYALTWDCFVQFSGEQEELNRADITMISVGFNAKYSSDSASYGYTLKNFGYFKGTAPEAENAEMILHGIENNSKLTAHGNKTVTAQIPDGLRDISVYLDYRAYGYTDNGDGTIAISLEDLSEGAHYLTVTGFDRFHYAVRKSISFYAADIKNTYVKGTFFN